MVNVTISGAKNAALPLIAATLLQKNIYYFKNIPLISDINTQINILKQFNVKVNYINKNSIIIDTTCLKMPKIIDYTKNTRGTYYFIGSSVIYDVDLEYILETGCKIDVRSIDFHVTLLELLGKTVTISDNKLLVTGKCIDSDITYSFIKPSVGATINAIFMFSKCKSMITLHNYAKDPYIINTILLLKKMGINIIYNETSIIMNNNNNNIQNNLLIEHSIMKDPIEALSYIIFSGINLEDNSISNYTIGPININNLGDTYSLLEEIGISLIESETKNLYYIKRKILTQFTISTGYFPKIYTDIQPFLALLGLYVKNGKTTIQEKIWNDRFKYANELNKFGYNIEINNNEIIIDTTLEKNIINLENLENIDFSCTDLRGGMALLFLMRKYGVKKDPNNKHYIDRGYYNYENNIQIILENKNNLFHNFDTKCLSNIKIGGISKYYTEVFSEADIISVISYCKTKNIKYKLIGYGNNCYFCEYYDGLIIKNNHSNIHYYTDEKKNYYFTVSSGITLLDFILYVSKFGYDLSSLAGIPGTIGAAIYGNAGAYGMEICQIIESCRILSNDFILEINNSDMKFQYRNSIFKIENTGIILDAKIYITKSEISPYEINKKIKNILSIRNNRIPTENTLGSIFKNIIKNDEKIYAWKLIDELNLRDCTLHNITVLKTHPNIFMNNNNATTSDLNILIKYITDTIYETHSIIIKTEIEYIDNV